MPVSKDFRVKNGLVIGSSGTGNICAGSGLFTNSLSSAALSGDGRAITTTAAVSLSGDVGGYVSLDNLTGEKNITATIQANSVALGTDTTGNYVQSLALNTTTPTLTGTSLAAAEGNTITGLGLSATGVTATSYGSTTAIPVLTILEDGRISSASTSTVATTLSTTGDAGTGDVSLLTQGLTIAGTSNEIETSASNQTVTIGLPDDVTIAGNLTVNGTHTTLNTSVTSTTTATENNFVITSTDDGASASPDLKLWRNSASPADNDEIGNIFFTGTNSASEATDYAHILGQITDVTDGTEDGRLTFKTMAAGTLSDRLTINSGSVGIGTTNPNNTLTVAGTLSASGQITGNVTGGLTGNADTATALETARNIGGVSFDGTAAIVPTTIVVADTTNTKAYLGMFESATGDLLPKTDANIFYNASTSRLTVDGSLSASGIIYADAFNSVTGGSTIDFQDPVAVTGTLTLSDDIVHSGDTDTRLSFTTDLITLSAAGSSLVRVDGTNNVVGIGTVSTASPSIPTVVEFNNNTTAYKAASATITTGASAALLTIPTATYRSGKVVLQAVAASGGHMDVTELLYIHNGTSVYTTEYGTIRVGDAIGTYTGEIVGSNVEIRVANGVGVTAEFVGSVTMLSV